VAEQGAVELLELIDSLEELVVQARRLPMGGNLVVDRKRMLDVVDQLRLAVPGDLRQAAQILEAREQILEDAQRTAERIVEQAKIDRERLIDTNAVVIEAEERGQAILAEAEQRARHVIAEADATAAEHLSEAAEAATKQLDDADQYALELLRRLQAQLNSYMESIRTSISSLEDRR
jgi:F0F1-type ATP synthase membrane subunit b/b'